MILISASSHADVIHFGNSAYITYLHDIKRLVYLERMQLFCPVDPYVHDDYKAVISLMKSIETVSKKLMLLGVSQLIHEKYGYIIPENDQAA